MKQLKILILILLPLSFLIANENYTDKYLYMSLGNGYGHIKDSGTSPLTYHGALSQANVSFLKENSKNTINFLLHASGMVALAGGNSLNYFKTGLEIDYMHDLPFFNNNNYQVHIGSDFNIDLQGIYSPAYENAAFNLDMMIKLSLSTRFAYTFNIKEKQLKIAGLYLNIKEQQYTPYFKLNIPVLTFNGRPEYAYVNVNDLGFFDRHYYFGGIPLSTELGIKKHLPNGNLISLAYAWDMFYSGKKDIYLLELGSHQLQLSLYFKLN